MLKAVKLWYIWLCEEICSYWILELAALSEVLNLNPLACSVIAVAWFRRLNTVVATDWHQPFLSFGKDNGLDCMTGMLQSSFRPCSFWPTTVSTAWPVTHHPCLPCPLLSLVLGFLQPWGLRQRCWRTTSCASARWVEVCLGHIHCTHVWRNHRAHGRGTRMGWAEERMETGWGQDSRGDGEQIALSYCTRKCYEGIKFPGHLSLSLMHICHGLHLPNHLTCNLHTQANTDACL